MKLPLSWLKEFVDIEATPGELAEKLLLSGTKVEEIKKTRDDSIFDLEITSNRPDTLSIIGLAREVSAIYDIPLKLPPTSTSNITNQSLAFEISQSDPLLAPVYAAVVL